MQDSSGAAAAEQFDQRGHLHLKQGKLHEAAIAYRAAIAQSPNFAQAQNNLGIALARLGQ